MVQFTQANDIFCMTFKLFSEQLYIHRLNKTIVIVSDNFLTAGRQPTLLLLLNLYLTRNSNSWDLKSHLQEGPGQDRQHI